MISTEKIAPDSFFASETTKCNLSREERSVFLGSYVRLKGELNLCILYFHYFIENVYFHGPIPSAKIDNLRPLTADEETLFGKLFHGRFLLLFLARQATVELFL